MRTKACFALCWALLLGSPLAGQEWARKMFETTRHDFGSVARGAKADFEFVLKNIYVEDIHISGVRASCGCTTPSIQKAWLKTYESGAIVAKFNTDKFSGHRAATLTVTFDKPFFAQVQLYVQGSIHTDVLMEPGSVQFGSVDEGTAVEKTVAVGYSGYKDWKLLEVKSVNPHLSVTTERSTRRARGVAYELSVRLDENTPPGYLREHLTLVTNDPAASRIPLLVEGEVRSGIAVSPASLFLGVLEPGQKVTKQVVVRGTRPFRIVSVTCDGGGFELPAPVESDSKPLHVLPVTFVAGQEPGKIHQTIRIQTDQPASVPELSAYAVVAATGSGF